MERRAEDMLLRVVNAGWRVGDLRVLEHVNFDVGPGEFVALMGRNGAGKSTLLDLIAGVRQPSEGAIILDGRPLTAWPAGELARMIGHLPQMVRTDIPFSAEQLVLMGRYPYAVGWEESAADDQIVEQVMERCGCLALRDRRAATLSGGERQRVLLAACLAQQPRLLLLDEPATFLDVDHQLQCFGMLRKEAEHGAACISVTHDINLALTFCTRLVVLAENTVARDLSVEAASASPEWLRLFSPRLDVMRTPEGRPWVWYP
ncbi:MAG TPA: ABC transporter ATP-binding protein [Vicinamibacterales bacterium]